MIPVTILSTVYCALTLQVFVSVRSSGKQILRRVRGMSRILGRNRHGKSSGWAKRTDTPERKAEKRQDWQGVIPTALQNWHLTHPIQWGALSKNCPLKESLNGQGLRAPSDQSLLGAAQEGCVLGSKIETNPGEAAIQRPSHGHCCYHIIRFITDWKTEAQRESRPSTHSQGAVTLFIQACIQRSMVL